MKKKCLIIQHDHSQGGQIQDRMFWTSFIEGENYDVWDYGLKHQLIEQAVACGMDYKVMRRHKNGNQSVIETSIQGKK